jgi:CRISPR-associated protein (TIGR03986 family)
MADFHNPYHFVPVKNANRADNLDPQVLRSSRDQSTQVTHSRYVENSYSGRLVCRVMTEDPIFIGDKTEGTDVPKKVRPFEINETPAIPASTLRGLISSLAEAASNSAMRVLYDQSYSYRREMTEALSAIGMIIMTRDEAGKTKYELRPLSLPVLVKETDKNFKLPVEYNGMFLKPNLKVYLNPTSVPAQIRSETKHEFYYLKMKALSWTKGSLLPFDKTQDENTFNTRGKFLLAQKAVGPAAPIPKDEWEKKPYAEKFRYVRGFVRALDDKREERKRDFPKERRYELFIPYPDGAEKWKTIPVPSEVVDRFHDLADQRTSDYKTEDDPLLPFHPLGTSRNDKPKDKSDLTFRLKDGDLVYFKPTADGTAIAEISLSSIWRGRVDESHEVTAKKASTQAFFAAVDEELLPFNENRKTITIAEQLFGFVQQDKQDDEEAPESHKGELSLALAGRVRFSHAMLEGFVKGDEPPVNDNQPYLGETILKILASPKPPSPAMYFKMKNGEGGYIRKKELNPRDHQPQGRKFYLHRDGMTPEPWRTRLTGADLGKVRKQVVRVTPLKTGAVFYFHIDFDNLSKRELGLLLYALQPFGKDAEPLERFCHKIGMGKPIGLGKVKIAPVGLFRINRQRRYTVEGYEAPRYSEVWLPANSKFDEWPENNYKNEKIITTQMQVELDIKTVREGFADVLDDDIHRAIEMIGDPRYLQAAVHTPTVRNQPNKEKETFKWFVENDKPVNQKRQFLKPISATAQSLEPLEEL